MNNSRNKFIAFLTVFLVLFTTFAYSALSTSLTITSNARFKVMANVRVDDIGLQSTNNSLISYDSEYTKNTISSGFKLTSTSSSINYNVVISNTGNIDQVIYQINTISSNNDGIIIYIDDEPMNDKLPYKIPIGNTTIKITYKTTNPSNQTINIVNQFDFRKLYTVDYNTKGGSQIASQDKIENVDLTLTNSTPTKAGYTFAGWTDEENGTTAKYQAGSKYTLNESVILYAIYSRVTYNITYTLNGGTNNSNNPSTYNVETNDITLKDASKIGWTFTGWTGNGTSTPTKNLKLTKGSTGNKTFVAHFEKTITLTQKHGTTTTTQTYNLKDSETEHTFTLQNTVDSYPGWTFDGWLDNPTPKAKDYNPTGKVTISEDKTVYATYKKELTTTFVDYTGITKQTRTVKGTAYGNNECGGVSNQYPTVTSLTVSNYTDWSKLGWTTSTSASASVSLNSNTNYTLTEDKATTYYALYKQDVTLTYDANGGSSKPSDETKQRKVNSYSNTTYSHPTFTLKNTATKTGYTLSKWTISAPISADKNPTDSITIESGNQVTATAKWTANTYTIAYTLNAGSNPTTKPTSGTYDSNVQISNPTKTFTVNIDANNQGATIKNASGTVVTSASSNQTFAGWTSTVGSNAKTGSTTSNYVTWDGTSTTNTYFKNLTDTKNGTVTLTANWTAVNVTLPNITKTGYTCGYATSAGGNIAYQTGGSYTPSTTTNTATLFAKCNANTYTVTYNGNGNTDGSTTSSSHTYDVEKALTKNGFTKTGYTFAGWNTKADGTGTAYTNEQSVTNLATSGNVNLYAQWTANTYTVAYTMNGAAAKANQSVSYDSNLTLAKPTKTFTVNIDANSQGATIKNASGTAVTSASSLQTFAGWTGSNLSTSTAVYGTTTSPSTSWNGTTKIGASNEAIYLKNLRTTSGTVTLTANWTAVNVTLPNITKTGYTCGYATSAGGNIAYQTGGSYTPSTTTGSVTLFAKCNANQYTVTYNGNGNTGGSTTSSSHTYDEAKTLTKNGFTKTGYTFAGWNTKADGSGTNYEDEESVTNLVVSGNFNLYAQWAPNTNTTYTVYHYIKDLGANTYSLNNTENKTGTSDASLTLANLKKTITGFTYSNGSLTGSTSGPGTVVTTTTIAADGTREIYLFYTRDTHTVTLTKGTGINTVIGAGTYEYGASVTINNTLNAGYSFVNWTVGTTSTAFATSQSKTFTMGTSDVTYKANGQLINYSITYNLNGGSVSSTNPTSYNVTTDTFTLNNPTKTGYTFTGWTGSNGTTAQTTVSITKGSTGNKTYTANYTAKTYTLTLKPNGGKYNDSTSDASKTMIYDSTNNNSIGTASKTGYTFTGWWTASSGGTQVYNANGQNVNASSYWTAAYNTGTWKYDGAVTLYAQFTKNDYSIAFNSNAPTGETVTGSMANLAMKYDEAKNLTSNGYSISGYTFAGWNTKADGSGTAYLNGASVTNLATSGTVTLYAQWTINTVTIGLQKDGSAYSNSGIKVTLYDGTTATSFTSTISSGSTATFTKVPAKTYNIYVGEDTNHKTTMVDSNVDVVVNSSSTSQTVKFYTLTIGLSNTTTTVNGTSISNNGTVVVAEGYAHTVVAAANTGYEFVNNSVIWSNTGTMTIANTKAASTTVVLSSAGKLTSTATAKSYVVTAKANDGSIASTSGWTGTGTSATKSVTYKETYGTLPSVSRTGYTLAGWNTKADGTGATITASTTVNTASAHDIYAIWTPNIYHVILNNQDATTSGTTDAYYKYKTVTNNCYYYTTSDLSTCLSNGYNISLPTKTGYTFGGYFTEENGGGTQYVNASGSFVNNIYLTVGDRTLYAKWTANTYTVTYNGNNNTSGSTVTSTHTYDIAKTLTANGFIRTGYTFGGWSTSSSDKSLIIDDTEYHKDSTNITANYQELKQYSVEAPFISGEVYQLEFDAKGTGNLTTYFYGVSGHLQVSNVTNSDGWTGSNTDGYNPVALTSSYKHYSVRFTLGSTGDGSKTKYVLLRAFKGNDCYAKNIRFFKVSSTSTAYTDEQSVINLATTGNVNLYAMWLANELTFGNQTITKTFSTSSQTANVTAATNGTGTYTYSKVSGESDITVSSAGVITIPASKTVNTTGYSVVIRATDSNSGKTKDATYTIKVNKKKGTITLTDTSKALTYPTAGNNTYNYDGDGTVSCSSSDTTYVTCSVDTTNHKINVTPAKPTSSAVTITVSAGAGTNYSAADNKTFTVTVAKGTLTATATALNAAYTGSAQYAKIKVTKSDWDGKTIVSGTSTSYGTTVTSNGAYNTNYDLKPGYTNVQASTTIYYKITGGTYYNDLEGSTTAQITQTTTTTSLSAITKTYNGSAQAASGATAKLANNTAISNAAFTYTYYSGDSCSGTALSSAPTAAGTYSVKATLTGTTNYASSTSSCAKYTMNKRDVTLTAGSTSRAWNGSALTNNTCSGNNLVSGHTVICTMTSGSTITNAGSVDNVISTYSIKSGTTDLTSNYNVTAAKGTLTVTVATPTVSLTAKEADWSGSAISANTATVSPNSSPSITYTYYTDSSCSTKTTTSQGASASGGAPSLAGQYYVIASAAAVTNKTAAANSTCTSHKINVKTPTVSLTAKETAYTGSAIAANTATVSPNSSPNITYTYYTDSSCSTKTGTTVATGLAASSGAAPVVAGQYYVKASAAAVTNKTAAANSTCTSHKITTKAITVTAGSSSRAWNGSALTNSSCSANSIGTGDAVTCTMTSGSTITVASTTANTNASVNNTISTYVIKKGNTDVTSSYSVTTATGTLTISYATPTVTLTAKTADFTGSAIAANDPTVSPNSSPTITKKYYTDSSCTTGETTTAPTNAGQYYAKAYAAAVSTKTNAAASACVSHKINTKTPTVTLTAKETAYTGSAIAANTATVSPNSSPTITYTYYTDSSCSTKTGTTVATGLAASSGAAPVVAGQYYVIAHAAAVTNKTEAADSACTSHKITTKAITVTAGSTSRAWNGSALTNSSCTANAIGTGDSVTCAMTSASTITNAGSVDNVINTVTIKKGSTDVTSSYSVTKAKGTLTVTVATPTVTLTAKTDAQRTYTGSAIAANNATVSPNSSPTITKKYYTNSTCTTGETTTAPTNYGTYYAKAYAAAVTNKTAAASSTCVNHSILKASATNTIKITGTNTWGSTLTATITTNSDGAKSYKWYYSSTAGATSGGTAVGATNCNTGSTCVIPQSLVGKYIYVVGSVGAGTNWNAATDSVDATDATNNGTQAVAKKTCPVPTNVAIATDKKVSWTNASGASSYQISMSSDSGFAAHTNGAAYNSITAATGTRTVYVRSVCDTTYYTAANSANASKSTTVYSVTLTKGTGIASVSGAGNFINGASTTISATVSTGYAWTNWTGTSTLTSNSNSITVNGNKSYTANATANTYNLVKVDNDNLLVNGGFESYYLFNAQTFGNNSHTWDKSLNGVPGNTSKTYFITSWGTGQNAGVPVPEVGYHAHMRVINGNAVVRYKTNEDYNGDTGANVPDGPTVAGTVTTGRWLGISQGFAASKLTAGKKYAISMDVYRVSGTTYINTGLYHKISSSSSAGFHSGTKNFIPTTTGQWQRFTYIFTLSSDYVTTSNPALYIYGMNGGSGELYVDNVTLEEVTESTKTYATAYTPTELATPTRTGYTFNGWYNNESYTTQLSTSKTFTTANATFENVSTAGTNAYIYGKWTANELTFANQTITKTFSTSSQTANVTAATNGTGTYTYSKVSGESDITVSSTGVITIPASKTVNTTGYSVVIRATDSNSGKTKDATYTIKINKATCPAPTNIAVSTAGAVTWTAASGASSYQISIDNSTFTAATSGVNYNSTITAATGSRTVYVRSVCSTTNYSSANSANATKAVTVYSVTLTKGTGIKTVSGAGNYITGATVTLGATADTGYTWSKWTQTSGGSQISTANAYSAAISGNWAYTANATANPYTVTAKANSGSITATTGWTGTGTSATKSVTYKGTYGTLPTVSRTGYTLAGWNTKSDGTGTTITSSTTMNTASAHDIYAIWVPSEISLADKTLNKGTYGTAYTSNAFDAATNGTGTYTYTLSNAPTGATINSTNRTISFTASTAAGTYNVTVTATDNETSKTDTATMTIVINKRDVTLTAGSSSRAWNGSALTNSTCTGDNLVSGHTVTCTMTSGSTITLASTTANTSASVNNTISTYVIKSGTTDLTSNYNVTTATGTLTISYATPTVTLTAKTDAQRTYTGSAIAANNATVSPNSSPTITKKYYTNSTCTTGETTTAPTNAGTYYAKAYAAAVSTKTNAASSTCVNHSIIKAAATNSVKITGTNTWGSTLTATITTNSDGAKSYKWYYSSTVGATSGGTAVGDTNCNTGSTCVIPKSLIGKYIYVVGSVGAGTNWNAATDSVDATDATTNTTQAVDKKTLSVTRTNYSAQYDGSAHGVIVKVTNSDWDGKTIVSGTTTSYGTTVTSNGAYNTNYTLSPTYTDYAASARTVYYKVNGGTYYKDYTGSGTVTISKKTATNTIKITGTNTWGSTLTATITTNSNGTKSYKWYYSSTAGATSGGTAVGDTNCNTGSTCVIPQSLVGKYIYVVGSVGASTNYTTPADSVDATDATANTTQAVAKKTGTNSIAITGTNTWGSTLTATITTNSNGTKSYKWYYSSTAGATSGGTAVGATNCNTGNTCVIPNTLVGKYIYVVGSVGTSTYYTTPSDSVDATDATANTTQAVAKKTCPAPTNVAIATDKKVSWTNASGASSYQISIDGTTFAAHTNGAAYNSITAATGTRTVYVRSVCDTTYYTAANSANASKSTTVYSLTLTAGTGVSSVSGAGNYINGASASIDATVKTGYTWTNWTGSSTITTKATSVTVNANKSYTANATANTYTIAYALKGGTNASGNPTSGTYDERVGINYPSKTYTLNFNANSQGATIKDQSGNTISNISFDVYFSGWTSNNLGSNALGIIIGIPNDIIESWNGNSSLYQIYMNLRESGTVTMEANWAMHSVTLPNITKTGYLCGYSTTASGNIEYYSGDTFTTSSNTGTSDTLYAKCVQYNYTIEYAMQGGELPTSHPEGGFTNQDVYITNPSTKTVTINFDNAQGATIKNSSNQTITSMTSSQTFKGWKANTSGTNAINTSTAKIGTTANPTTAWNGSETKYNYFKNLKSSGNVILFAEWNSSSITLPNATLSGRNCGYASKYYNYVGGFINYNNGQTYSAYTYSNVDTLYVICLMAENLEYNTGLYANYDGNFIYENNIYSIQDDAQRALDVIADLIK